MLRAIIIFSFLISFIYSLWLFSSRNTKSLRENIETAPSHTKPRLVLEDFVIKKYKNDFQDSHMEALSGAFWAPNKVEMKGGIQAWKIKDGEKQVINSHEMHAFLKSDNLIDILERSDLDTAKFLGFVEIAYSQHVLQTEEASYIADEEKIFSSRSVQIHGPKRMFTGKEGFRLYLREEMLDVYGKVRGWVYPDP